MGEKLPYGRRSYRTNTTKTLVKEVVYVSTLSIFAQEFVKKRHNSFTKIPYFPLLKPMGC